MGEFPSGQRGQTVNLLSVTSVVRIHLPPPKILGSKVPENFYLLPLHSSLFTKKAPENFEVIGNSEELKSENYIGSDSSQVSPPIKER